MIEPYYCMLMKGPLYQLLGLLNKISLQIDFDLSVYNYEVTEKSFQVGTANSIFI